MGLFEKSRHKGIEYRLVPPQTPEEAWERYWDYDRPRTRLKVVMWVTVICILCTLLAVIFQR